MKMKTEMDRNIREKLDMSMVKSLMEDTYTPTFISYDDNLNGQRDLLQECLDRKDRSALFGNMVECYLDSTYETEQRIIDGLKTACINAGFGEEETECFFDEHEDIIRGAICERDCSDPVKELLENTSDIPARIELHSNFDCINSHWLESQGGYQYTESYFGDMVDALNLNPHRLKRYLTENGEKTAGHYPDKTARNGRETVTYESFCQELINSCCGANLLTFYGTVKAMDLWETGFSFSKIVIHKGNRCGLFSSIQGGGSLLDMELQHDVEIRFDDKARHSFRMVIDCKSNGYSIGEVYGVDDSFFGNSMEIYA